LNLGEKSPGVRPKVPDENKGFVIYFSLLAQSKVTKENASEERIWGFQESTSETLRSEM